MDYPSEGQSPREASPFTARAILKNEWPYLLVLVFALFGVAYTSLSRSPMAIYWIVLAPVIGVICVVSRWREISGKDDRLRLLWTQALHWAAVLLAMHLMFVADVARMMNADGAGSPRLRCWRLALHRRCPWVMADWSCRAHPWDRRSRDCVARTVRALHLTGGLGCRRDRRAIGLAQPPGRHAGGRNSAAAGSILISLPSRRVPLHSARRGCGAPTRIEPRRGGEAAFRPFRLDLDLVAAAGELVA